jgi:hypothetical protein
MRIALDYDGTYTQDPELWDRFIKDAFCRGHDVRCVTMRHKSEGTPPMPCAVEFTGRKAKVPHMASIGLNVDVWIDDSPRFLMMDA